MSTGTVKWFNEKKGFGFITPDDSRDDVFIPNSEIQKSGHTRRTEGEFLFLRAHANEPISKDELINDLVGLCKAINRYHIACDGRGLTIDDWRTFVWEDITAGVHQ